MTFRARHIALVALVSLSLGGCAATAGPEESAAGGGGTIEMAVSETCVEGSDPQCIDVDGQYVLHPASFDKATVEEAVVSGQQDNAVEITFTSEGAAVLSTVTDRAARAGADARLLLKIGDDIRGAIEVKEALGGDEITIALSPDENPQDVVDLLSKG